MKVTLSAFSFASRFLPFGFSSCDAGEKDHFVSPTDKTFGFQSTAAFYFDGLFYELQMDSVEMVLVVHVLFGTKN